MIATGLNSPECLAQVFPVRPQSRQFLARPSAPQVLAVPALRRRRAFQANLGNHWCRVLQPIQGIRHRHVRRAVRGSRLCQEYRECLTRGMFAIIPSTKHSPLSPGGPSAPGNPSLPGFPCIPGCPGRPGNPASPGAPAIPGKPMTPSSPGIPGRPANPGCPFKC